MQTNKLAIQHKNPNPKNNRQTTPTTTKKPISSRNFAHIRIAPSPTTLESNQPFERVVSERATREQIWYFTVGGRAEEIFPAHTSGNRSAPYRYTRAYSHSSEHTFRRYGRAISKSPLIYIQGPISPTCRASRVYVRNLRRRRRRRRRLLT